MPLLIVQLAVLVAIAFVIGCLLGRFIRRRSGSMPDHERTIIAAAHATLPVDEKQEETGRAETPAKIEESSASYQPTEPEKLQLETVPDAEVVGNWSSLTEKAEADAEPARDPGRPELLEAARLGKPDDLTVIKGIGKAVQGLLNEIGVFHYDQIANWSDDESRWVERNMGFPRRVEREGWIGQAARLTNAANKIGAKKAAKSQKTAARPKSRRTKKAGE